MLALSWSGGVLMLHLELWMIGEVPNIIIGHLEQFLFSSYCSKRIYFEIAVKFSFQEHARPPRIQVGKKNFDSRISKSGLVLN